ncbi:MAG: hypothetical protein NC131_21960 [Roseburia sp.]|nr:hypothetical protein [Roseburia sp.]
MKFIERTLGTEYDGTRPVSEFIGEHLVKARLEENRAEMRRLEEARKNARPPVWTMSGRRGPDPDRADGYEYAGQRWPGGTFDFTPSWN